MAKRRPLLQCTLVLSVGLWLTACATGPGQPDDGDGPPGRGRGKPGMGQRPSSGAQEDWRAYDLNGDGRVTRAEFTAVRHLCFVRIDANGDGVLTQVEIQAVRGGYRETQESRAPAPPPKGGESDITREEYDRAGDSLWRLLDTNGDTVIAGMELGALSAAAQNDLCRSSAPPSPRDGRGGPGPGGGPGQGGRR